jgi:NAD(P)-dependent dehydrogenase (short-subunit alcohol dehydrogenase family)
MPLASKEKKAALITGAAKRLGREMALALARKGFDIAATYNSSKTEAAALRDEVRSLGRECAIAKRDLRDPAEAADTMRWALETFPNLAVVVNNASLYAGNSILETSVENLERDISLHLTAPFVLTRDFAAAGAEGVVLNMLDTRIGRHHTTRFSYLISKKALAEFTAMAAAELGPKIRVNGVAPGLILPPEGEDDAYVDALAKKIPAGVKGKVEDVVSAALFLVENKYLTGQIIHVGGGMNLID